MNNGTLWSIISGPLNKDEENIKLKDVVGFTGRNLEHVSFSFPTPILLEMKATPFSFSCQEVDRLTWHLSSNGEFKLREAYQLVANKVDDLKLCFQVRGCGRFYPFQKSSIFYGNVSTIALLWKQHLMRGEWEFLRFAPRVILS